MFEGFCPETIDFLWGIRMNNNRDWFLDHKKDYVNHLYEPMKALGKDLYELFLDRPGNLLKVSRIYRDARRHHALPYKESLWICIRQDVDWWVEHPCLYFEICPEEVSYGFFYYKPSPATMETLRNHLAANPDEFLKLLKDTQKATGVPVTANVYKRPKAAPREDLQPFFSWKDQLSCVITEPIGPEVFGPELGVRAKDFIGKLIPLYEYFCKF